MNIILVGSLASLLAGLATGVGGAARFAGEEGLRPEIIPETHSRGNHREATFGVILGFIVMMVLVNLFKR
jgi:ZIP family zinc transporter